MNTAWRRTSSSGWRKARPRRVPPSTPALACSAGAVAGKVTKHLDVKDLGALAGLLDDKAIPLSIRARMSVSVDNVIRIVGAETTKALADQGSAKLADAVARRIRTARYSSAPASAQKFPLGEPGMAHLAVLGSARACAELRAVRPEPQSRFEDPGSTSSGAAPRCRAAGRRGWPESNGGRVCLQCHGPPRRYPWRPRPESRTCPCSPPRTH